MIKQTKIWTTKTGQKIRICDMTDDHLQNCITFLEKKADAVAARAISDGYNVLGCLHGEMAIESVERNLSHIEMNGIDPSELTPLYDNLIAERMRRGLNARTESKGITQDSIPS